MASGSRGRLQKWDSRLMEDAIQAVLSGKMGTFKASKIFEVPQTTLERRVKKAKDKNITPNLASEKGIGLKPIFSPTQEKQLVDLIMLMDSRMFGLTGIDLRRLAYEFAVMNNVNHRFSESKKKAGKDWLVAFLNRNPQLVLLTPDENSLAKEMGFNAVSVNDFFDKLGSLHKQCNFSSDRIYNAQEIGITITTSLPGIIRTKSNLIRLKGKRQVGNTALAESGCLVTVEVCSNAAGTFVPPLFVFPEMNPPMLDGAPPGSFVEFDTTGWMKTGVFFKWFERFVEFSKPSESRRVLLLLDGHTIHSKSIELMKVAQENHVELLCFPPHCSRQLQPLDVSFVDALSQRYSEIVKLVQLNNSGLSVGIHQVAELYGRAFAEAAIPEIIVEGFAKTGICPFNRDIFMNLFAVASNVKIEDEFNEGGLEIKTEYSSDSETTQNHQSVSKDTLC